jgi:hemerythrin-like metal-binding protein
MAAFAWNESYSVHVKQLDAQHQVLFNTINSLADAMRAGRGDTVIRDTVGKLAAYTQTHFLQEEVLMNQTAYPQFTEHKAEHAKLMASVGQYQTDLNAGRKPNSVAVLAFLQTWLVEHIRKSDRAYSDHLNAHGIH